MPWTRLDDRFHTNPKILGLSHQAFRLYVVALNWSVSELTDGHIPMFLPPWILPLERERDRSRFVAELENQALWKPKPDGWEVHDFANYQETSSKVQERRSKWAVEKRGQREMSVADNPADTPPDSVPDPVRAGVPIPIPKEAKASTRRSDETQTNREGVWTALEDLFGEAAETERKLRGKVVRSIIGAGGTFTEVKKRAGAWPKLFPRGTGPPLTLTATALEKWWGQLGLIVETGQPPPDCAICGNRRLVGITSEGEVVSVEMEHVQVRQCSCVVAR